MPDVELSDDLEQWRRDVAAWLADHVVGDYADVEGSRRPGRRGHRLRRPRRVGARARQGRVHRPRLAGLEHGGRGASLTQQIIWAEEYARAQAPARVEPHGREPARAHAHRVRHAASSRSGSCPAILARRRALVPGLQRAQRGLRPRQRRDRGRARRRRVGDQRAEGVDVARARGRTGASWSRAPIRSRHGTRASRSCSCRWTSPASRSARSCRSPAAASSTRCSSTTRAPSADLVVGEVDDGWRVAMGLLGFERGVSTLAPAARLRARARRTSSTSRVRADGVDDPVIRQRLADAWIGLRLMRLQRAAHAWREAACPGPEASISSCSGPRGTATSASSTIDVLGADGHDRARRCPTSSRCEQKLFLFSRADTIYGGSNEIQRNVLGERVLGLPPRAATAVGARDPDGTGPRRHRAVRRRAHHHATPAAVDPGQFHRHLGHTGGDQPVPHVTRCPKRPVRLDQGVVEGPAEGAGDRAGEEHGRLLPIGSRSAGLAEVDAALAPAEAKKNDDPHEGLGGGGQGVGVEQEGAGGEPPADIRRYCDRWS